MGTYIHPRSSLLRGMDPVGSDGSTYGVEAKSAIPGPQAPKTVSYLSARLAAAQGRLVPAPNPTRPVDLPFSAAPLPPRSLSWGGTRKTALDGAGWRLSLRASHLPPARPSPTPTAISDFQLVPPGQAGRRCESSGGLSLPTVGNPRACTGALDAAANDCPAWQALSGQARKKPAQDDDAPIRLFLLYHSPTLGEQTRRRPWRSR